MSSTTGTTSAAHIDRYLFKQVLYNHCVHDRLLEEIHDIRESIGVSKRHPVITRVREEGDALFIECEDRADKSIVIGTGGWVVGKLATRLGYARITVSSRLDGIMRLRMRIASRHALPGWAHHVRAFFDRFVEGATPPPFSAAVMGEELMWVCGFLEAFGGSPILVHTGFVDEHVKNAYPHTTFVKCEASVTSYATRRKQLTDESIDIATRAGLDVILGVFESTIEECQGMLLIDPQRFFALSSWECSRYEKRRFKPRIFALSDENRAALVHRTLADVFNGLMEPTRAARVVYDHWTPIIEPDDEPQDASPDAVVRYRRANALRQASEISAEIGDALSSFPRPSERTPHRGEAIVAWSGGTDSSACIRIANAMGFSVRAVTVRTPYLDEAALLKQALGDGISVDVLDPCEDMTDIFEASTEGRMHPCGRCHSVITATVEGHARQSGTDIVIYGDMISTGAQSIVADNGLIVWNLPASLALNKRQLASWNDNPPSDHFGCSHLRLVNQSHAYAKKISLQRVLRELRAQAIDRQYALKLITDIMS